MEIVTSWAREATEKIAVNSLREGLTVEMVARITGLTLEQVQQLQTQLQSEDSILHSNAIVL